MYNPLVKRKPRFRLCFFIAAGGALFAAEPPAWVAQGAQAAYPQKEYIAAEGRGKNKKAAESDALAALSQYFEARIESTINARETIISENKKVKSTTVLEEINFVQSGAKLFAVRYAPPYYDKKEKEYITVAFIKREEAWRIFEPRVKNEADAFRELWRSAESETEPIKSFFAYKAADNFSRRAEFVQTMNFGRIINPDKMNSLVRDTDDAKARLPAKLSTARSMTNIFIDINNDYESNITGALTKLLSEEGLNITTNKKTARAVCKVTVDEGLSHNEFGDFYYPKITVALTGKNDTTLFSYSAAAGKQAAMDAKVAKRRAYGALAAALENNFRAEFDRELSVE